MDTVIKIIPLIVGLALGVVSFAIFMKYIDHSIAVRDVLLILPAAMVLLTGIYIIYRAFKDIRLKE